MEKKSLVFLAGMIIGFASCLLYCNFLLLPLAISESRLKPEEGSSRKWITLSLDGSEYLYVEDVNDCYKFAMEKE